MPFPILAHVHGDAAGIGAYRSFTVDMKGSDSILQLKEAVGEALQLPGETLKFFLAAEPTNSSASSSRELVRADDASSIFHAFSQHGTPHELSVYVVDSCISQHPSAALAPADFIDAGGRNPSGGDFPVQRHASHKPQHGDDTPHPRGQHIHGKDEHHHGGAHLALRQDRSGKLGAAEEQQGKGEAEA